MCCANACSVIQATISSRSMAGEFMSSPIFRWRVAAQHFLRESVAKPAQVVGFKGVAQVGESCSNATKLLNFLHSVLSEMLGEPETT